MIEIIIRARTGLHAGATWRFDRSMVTLGASSKADVFLCDTDVPDELLSLKKTGRKVLLEVFDERCQLSRNNNSITDGILFTGQSCVLTFRHIQLDIHVVRSSAGPWVSLLDQFSQLSHLAFNLIRRLGAKAIVGMLFLISMAMTTLVLFFGTAGVAKSEAKPHLNTPAQRVESQLPVLAKETVSAQMARLVADEFSAFVNTARVDGLSIVADDGAVNVNGEMSRQQLLQFERALIRVNRDYGDRVSIHAQIKLSEEQLKVDQFDVEQVSLGQKPVVILRDGTRLYVGGAFEGLTVLEINSERVVLRGDSNYEISL